MNREHNRLNSMRVRQSSPGASFPKGNSKSNNKRVEWPRDKYGNLTKWVEGMALSGCDSPDGGKHLRFDCPKGKRKNSPMHGWASFKKGPNTETQTSLIAPNEIRSDPRCPPCVTAPQPAFSSQEGLRRILSNTLRSARTAGGRWRRTAPATTSCAKGCRKRLPRFARMPC